MKWRIYFEQRRLISTEKCTCINVKKNPAAYAINCIRYIQDDNYHRRQQASCTDQRIPDDVQTVLGWLKSNGDRGLYGGHAPYQSDACPPRPNEMYTLCKLYTLSWLVHSEQHYKQADILPSQSLVLKKLNLTQQKQTTQEQNSLS